MEVRSWRWVMEVQIMEVAGDEPPDDHSSDNSSDSSGSSPPPLGDSSSADSTQQLWTNRAMYANLASFKTKRIELDSRKFGYL